MSRNISEPIRVVIADDHPLVLTGTRKALDDVEEIEIIGEARDGAEALHYTLSLKPDVLLLDIEMPRLSGVEVVKQLQEKKSNVRVIALSAFDDREYVYGLLNNGASGYLLKEEANSHLLTEAIKGVVSGQNDWISRGLAVQLLRSKKREEELLEILTTRETEVLRFAALGLNNQAIGERLFISSHTVKNHLDNIKHQKVGVRTRTELVVWAWQNGLVKQGD